MPVFVLSEGVESPLDLEAVGERLLALVGREQEELSVVLCDDEQIRTLNQRWRGKDQATDVLSFPQDSAVGSPMPLLGDLVISLPTAERQARAQGHSVEVELRVLMVHGLLHLLGHDHLEPGERGRMLKQEGELLSGLGLDGAGLIQRA